jgi:hypothetical protein
MPKRSSKPKRPRDINRLAFSVVADAISDEPDPEPAPDVGKNPAAVALGRLGGSKGGKARAANLSPRQRRQIAKKAARARWSKKSAKRGKKAE